jgi:hypothetical protein
MIIKKQRKIRKLEGEEWKDVEQTGGRYQVSNFGRIKSFALDKKNGKIMKFIDLKGFNTISLKIDGKDVRYLVHKLTAIAWVTKESDDHRFVVHLDWNIRNNHFTNLAWKTKEEYYKRMGQHLKDLAKDPNRPKVINYSKLNTSQVQHIKAMLERGVKQNLIAKMFCVSEMQITRIKRGENWGDVQALPMKNK